MLEHIRADFSIIRERDPAARGWIEIMFCYPGFQALCLHRLSHTLWKSPIPMKLAARVLSQMARTLTGIEIHPGARIGRSVFIDHGMGVVIGETTELEPLFALSRCNAGRNGKREWETAPNIGRERCRRTGKSTRCNKIGNNTRIGVGSVSFEMLMKTVQSLNSGRVIHKSGTKIDPLAHSALPDTEANVIRNLMERIDELETLSQISITT